MLRTTDELALLRRRITRLEWALWLLGAALCFLLLGGARARERLAQLERLELVDRDGRTTAVLESHPQGGGLLRLYDRIGNRAAVLTAVEGGKLALFGSSPEELVELGAHTTRDGGLFTLRNDRGQIAVRIAADERGRGYVGVFGEQGVGRTLQPQPSDALGARLREAP